MANTRAQKTAQNLSTLTTAGDIAYASAAGTPARLGIGSSAQVLTVASGVPSWATPGGPAFSVYRNLDQTISLTTDTKIAFGNETFDTDNCFDSTTNYRFTPTKAGYYQINLTVTTAAQPQTRAIMSIFKNGSVYLRTSDINTTNYLGSGSVLINFNGSTDYVEAYVYVAGSGTANITGGVFQSNFSGVWIRS